jgi:hypothetical protein
MRIFLYIAFIALTTSACSMIENFDGRPELTSPCASAADDGPCGPKRPVNSWLQTVTLPS